MVEAEAYHGPSLIIAYAPCINHGINTVSYTHLYRHISLSVRAGEVLGVTGLLGDGRSEIFRTVFGDAGKYQGNIIVGGKPCLLYTSRCV